MPFLKGMCPYYISIFHLFHQTGFYTIYFLPPVTLCFIQLPCKCIFKSCKRRNKAVAYQQNQFILEMMPDGILYSNLLLKMYLMSLKHNGVLLLHENLPHTPQTIATFTRHQIGTVERALQIFLKLGFVELLTDGAYYMPDIQLLVGRSSTEAERKRRERLRLQAQKLLPDAKADICPPENRDKEIREQKCARTNIRTYEVTEEDVV